MKRWCKCWIPAVVCLLLTVNRAGAAPRLILDAGHGGEDGGAVSKSGVAESSINLAIVYRLRELWLFCGTEPELTRKGEGAVYSEDAVTLREKKVSDIKNRVAQINNGADGYFISIHQNSLPSDPKVRGAQVFYNQPSGAEIMAQAVQRYLNTVVNGKAKDARAIDSSIYLTAHARLPGILVECGFLSNQEETELLQQTEHQQKLALCIFAGVQEFIYGEE